MSLRQLAALSNVSNAYLSQIERGLHQPSLKVVRAIAQALNISTEYLLSQSGVLESPDPAEQTNAELAISSDPVLTDEEKENDARVEAENEQRRQQWQSEYQAEAEAHRNRVEARMANAPAMEFSNKDAWDEATPQIAQSMYGASIATYAERWARLMQLELSKGKSLDEIWSSTSHEADLEGMSGHSQGIATHLLTETWVYGAELRKLHNAYWGSDSEDGTVNPAIITVGTD